MSKAIKKQDFILIAGILAVAALLFMGKSLLFNQPASIVEISVNGQVVETLPLDKNADLTINGAFGGTNHLIILDGEVWVDEASCPDKVCIHQGKIHDTGDIIVCLPNQMITKITGPASD